MRKSARYRVFLSVRYEVAADFVREFAEDLSRGGMFIRGGRGLLRHRDVMVEIDLPGYGIYQVRAEVAHVISAEVALQQGRTAGAGLSILEAPEGFDEALAGYLVRLSRRAGSIVLATEDEAAGLLVAAGYQVRALASPDQLDGVLASCELPLAGVVVPSAQLAAYAAAASGTSAAELLVPMEPARRIDELLVLLDRRL
ncbi:MAG TPA: PilZ domain-containing protein [Kofleriaceae bacterium]|nr:PilZ domain-containing protein [Kofleriaceae bacterium]